MAYVATIDHAEPNQKYSQLKAQGVPETDPELLKCRRILTVIAMQNQQRNAQTTNNPSAPATPTQSAQAQPTNNGTSADGATNGKAAPRQPQPETMVNKDQARTIKSQVNALQHLQSSKPIPQAVQAQLMASKQVKNESPSVVNHQSGDVSQREVTPAHPYLTFRDPRAFAQTRIPYLDHTSRGARPLIPSTMPLGIDINKLRQERELILYNRITSRKTELENLPANLGSWDTSKSDLPVDDGKLKLKALIEYKMLCLLPKQQALRKNISREIIQNDNLSMTANRANYRRIKKQSLHEARMTEKLEREQRDAHENKEKKKHNDFLRSIVSHGEALRNSANMQRQRVQRLGRIMMTTHATIEKDEQKRVERTAKQRLQALKANDEETYLKLLGQAKDSRITHLLSQTDGFLGQLAASVKEQQRGAQRLAGEEPAPEEPEPEEDDSEDENGGKKVDYYEVAHRIKEEVTEQATSLVGGTLKEYQIKGLQWMISLYNNNLNGILADEMGLGKTIQTISLVTYLIEKKRQPGPYLIIVPLSTLTNWTNEFEKWAPSVSKIVYKGPPAVRKNFAQRIRYGQFQVLLTTYEFIIKDRPVLSKIKWLHMIVDEGHRMKNAESKLSSTITQYYTTRFRLILTGTPLQNSLPELWAILNFVLPKIFKSVKSFDDWFNTPFANTGGQDQMNLSEEESLLVIRRLHKVLRPFLLRRLKKDVEKDLPDKTEKVIKCNFSALQARLYKQLSTENRLMVQGANGQKTGLRGLSNMLMQLRKLCNHPFVFEEIENQMNPDKETNDLLWRTSGKFELLDRVLPKFQATGHRVLMFFQMTAIMNIMEDFLRLRGIMYLRLDGSTKADDRSELLKIFNAPNSPYFCFLLSTRAGGLGLNLQTADTVIIYDSDWNPHQDLQAQDRAHRIGQKNEVRILRLISSNSVEESILKKANYKLDMDGKVIQAGRFDNKSTNEERDEMLRVMLETAETADLENEEMNDEDLNTIMMRSDEEFELFQQMDRDRLANDPYGPGKALPRLMGQSELPSVFLESEGPVVEEVIEPTGRGARERTRIKYDDGLTEEQWLDAVDNDEDSIEAAVARKQGRIARRQANKERRTTGGGDSETESVVPSRASSEEPPPMPKKRGRKPNAEKRKAEQDLEVAEPPKKRGRQSKVPDLLSPGQRDVMQKILDSAYEAIDDLEERSDDPDVPPRGISGMFQQLPPRNLYPDYYQLIPSPISLKQIEKKINKKQYYGIKEFRDDITLLCNNCRTYNEDGSVLYQDANLIEVRGFVTLSTYAADLDDRKPVSI